VLFSVILFGAEVFEAVYLYLVSCRPPERRHGYEHQFHTLSAQQDQETLEAKRPRIENVSETHFTRAQPTSILLAPAHTIQDTIRTTGEVKKVINVHAYPKDTSVRDLNISLFHKTNGFRFLFHFQLHYFARLAVMV